MTPIVPEKRAKGLELFRSLLGRRQAANWSVSSAARRAYVWSRETRAR